MAFNPFTSFRKHQKVLLAGVTIMAMFSFIVFTGSSLDQKNMDRIGGLFGRSRATKLFSLYNTDYDAEALMAVQDDRVLADAFIRGAREQILEGKMAELRANPNKSDPFAFQKIFSDPAIVRPYSFRAVGGAAGQAVEYLIWQHEADRLGIALTEKDVGKEFRRLTGNQLTKADVLKLISNIRKIFKEGNRPRRVDEAAINAALAKEFRARLAQEAMVGRLAIASTETTPAVPAPVTPDDFWDYYKKNSTRFTVALVPFKVEDYLDKVTAKPTESDLKTLYNQYKSAEPQPMLSTPGFKQSRRVAVEWVSGRADAPELQATVKQAMAATLAARQTVAGAFLPLGGVAAAAVDVSFPSVIDADLVRPYERWKYDREQPNWNRPWGAFMSKCPPLHDAGLEQPTNAAALVGQLTGSTGSPTAGLNGVGAFLATATAREAADRVKYGATFVLSGSMGPLATAAAAIEGLPATQFQPFTQTQDFLVEKVVNERTRDLLESRLKDVAQAVRGEAAPVRAAEVIGFLAPGRAGPLSALVLLNPKSTPTPAARAAELVGRLAPGNPTAAAPTSFLSNVPSNVARLIEEYHLTTGKSTEARDDYHLADDPGLAPFKEAFFAGTPNPTRNSEAANLEFARTFTRENGVLRPAQPWVGSTGSYVYWLTDEVPEKVVPFEEVRKKVEDVWRFQKARELARKDVEDQAKKTHDLGGDFRKVKDFAASLKKTAIELPGLAWKAPVPTSAARFETGGWGPTPIPEDKVPLSGNNFVIDLTRKLQEKPVGETLVLADQPEKTVYLAVLVARDRPDPTEFYTAYKEATAPRSNQQRPPLFVAFERDQQDKYLDEFMARLKKDANYTPGKPTLSSDPISAPEPEDG